MSAILTVAAPLFAIIAAGVFAGRFKLMNEAHGASLNRFVFLFAMPAAVFRFTSTSTPPGADAAPMALAYFVCVAIVLLGSFLLARKALGLTVREAGTHAFGSTLGNAVFLGLPIVLTIEGWGAPYLVLMLVEGTFILSAGAVLMTWPEGGARPNLLEIVGGAVVRMLRNPIVAGVLAGFAWSLLGLPMPIGAAPERFLFYLGSAAGPVALFSLGLTLAEPREAPLKGAGPSILSIIIAKMVILPLATILAVKYLAGGGPAEMGAVATFTTVPMGVGVYVQAAHYGVYERRTAAALIATTALSVLTISAALYAFAP